MSSVRVDQPKQEDRANVSEGALENAVAGDALLLQAALLERVGEGVAVCHNIQSFPYVRFNIWNRRMGEITGYTMEEINRLGWYQSLYPDLAVRERARERMDRMRQGDDLVGEEWLITRADQERRIARFSTSVLRCESGVVHVLAVVEDVTDKKRIERERRELLAAAERANEAKDRFLAILSHELRNPLAPICNSLFILERAAPGGDQARRAQAIIARQVAHLARLIDDLLDMTRITYGKLELKRARLDLNELVQRTVDDHRAMFAAGEVRLELLPAPAVWVSGDWTRLAQVIGNLLRNAAKFTQPGGKTTVSVESDTTRGQAIVRVRDTGGGFAPEMLPRLFDPFAQADATLDRSKGGLGLGLALVKGLVESHGGSVGATSGGADKGATFTITLPLDSAIPAEPRPRRTRNVTPARHLLVIEDNVDAADSLREALELEGHQVDVAYSGREGLQKARASEPEVVLCDIGLPEVDGYAVARAIRAEPALGRVTLVALTGYGRPEDMARAWAAGFDAHLAKPASIDAIESLLAVVPMRT